MKLTQLRHMMAVAERGSLRAAARDLGVAQPAVTRSIHELEREFGVALFERHPRGVFVTDMGALLLRRAGAIVNEVRRAQEEIAQASGGIAGSVCRRVLQRSPHQHAAQGVAPVPQALSQGPHADHRSRLPVVEAGLLDGSIDFYIGPLHRQITRPGFERNQTVR